MCDYFRPQERQSSLNLVNLRTRLNFFELENNITLVYNKTLIYINFFDYPAF